MACVYLLLTNCLSDKNKNKDDFYKVKYYEKLLCKSKRIPSKDNHIWNNHIWNAADK